MSYTPDPTDVTEPKDSKGVGAAAAEFRALKQYVKTMQTRLTELETSQESFVTFTNATLLEIQEAAASFLGGDIGQITPFMRLGSVGSDLANHLLCDGRNIGRKRTEADGPLLPQPDISDSTEIYYALFAVLWDFMKYAANLWKTLNPTAADADCPVVCANWSSGGWLVTSFRTAMTTLGGDPTASAGWESGNYALYLPNLKGRVIRGANAYNGTDAVPPAYEPLNVLLRQPDYGRIPGTYQAASLLSGDDNNGTARVSALANVGATKADSESDPTTLAGIKELLGWDKVGALTSGSGDPYADPRNTTAKLRLSVAKTTTGADYNTMPDEGTAENDFYSKYFGAARVDNVSLPYFIRYR